MDTEKFRLAVIAKVYHIPANRNIALHQHPRHDELFYRIKGSGFGVLEDGEVTLSPGKVFVVSAGTMHFSDWEPIPIKKDHFLDLRQLSSGRLAV